ncbi:GFA family protein, partial [bacterium]|nr:GFA family protein [bacterium]
MNGSCLCGGVRFVVEGNVGPFELCHCNRCRKVSGSAFVSALVVDTRTIRFTHGIELIHKYEAPLLLEP